MAKKSKHEATIPNPKLEPLRVLVGEWNMIGTHRLVPNTTLHGHTSFSWFEGGAFLLMRSEIGEDVGIPSNIAIFGSDDVADTYSMLYFDARGVSRKFEVTLQGNTWHHWRNAPGFSQRFTGTFADDEQTIIGLWELSEDDVTWQRDLELTYTRLKENAQEENAASE
ncbi:MAG: hypothetical protein H0X24_07785 [Ktedonobacterales bacterium]|nr:hypothetical protein [Ktedonobacterales bacterium]